LICDDRVFIKPTAAGRGFIGTPVEGQPYPQAKPHFLIDDQIDNGPWVCQLVQLTVHALQATTKPRKKK